jgi:hypothetical protein
MLSKRLPWYVRQIGKIRPGSGVNRRRERLPAVDFTHLVHPVRFCSYREAPMLYRSCRLRNGVFTDSGIVGILQGKRKTGRGPGERQVGGEPERLAR